MVSTGAKWAAKLSEFGIKTIPMDSVEKRPFVYTSSWWNGFPTSAMNELNPKNISALCGQVSKLVVIDLDGPVELVRAYWASRPVLPATWQCKTPSGGRHLWFRIPDWYRNPIPRCKLWQGSGKHEEIAVLGERSLATCPPTQYGSKPPYKWMAGKHPLNSSPAVLPQWLLQEIIAIQMRSAIPSNLPISFDALTFSAGESLPVGQVNRLQILLQHGLKLASRRPNQSGWIPCFRPNDNDRVPSASVKQDGSVLWTSSHGSLNFLEALCLLGNYSQTEALEAIKRG